MDDIRKQKQKQKKRTLKTVNFELIIREMAASNNSKHTNNAGNPITENTNSTSCADEYDDFQKFVVRRPKRFYIGGFQPNITEPLLRSYIQKRGPKVSRVTIFRKPRYGNYVVIHVCIEDDDNTCYMTDDPCFWPQGIICKPWVSYGAFKSRQNETRTYKSKDYNPGRSSQTKYSRADWGQVNYIDQNRYSALDSDNDIE